jgi:2-polyprenyl-3-methyl-5-hydroxy-6-metoxy-1,4-benzoquinol methylase
MGNTAISWLPDDPKGLPFVQTHPGCRLCGTKLHRSLLDLGKLPLANRTVAAGAPDEPAYPLHARICDNCKLVQIDDVAPPEAVAAPSAYLSSSSATRVLQAGRYAARMQRSLGLTAQSLVIEIGSNDGYLLRHFQMAGIPVFGIDPARNAAAAADSLGIPMEVGVFNTGTAMEVAVRRGRADLLVANNVASHVPDLFDFAAGCACLLRPKGVMTLQVPHLLAVVQKVQFDVFRHDTYVYLSLQVLERVLRSVGLRVFDAEREPDHGGSLRIHACHVISPHPARAGLKSVRAAEAFAEKDKRDLFAGFSDRVAAACEDIRGFLQNKRAAGHRVAAYGAAVRGSTLLNACGITTDLISCVADLDPAKHGRCLPGSRVPIVPLEALLRDPPNDILVLPWTNASEIVAPLFPLRQLGTQLWAPVPRMTRL